MSADDRPPARVVLGLDVGTTGAKVVAFGFSWPWRRVAIREYPLLQPAPDQQAQDPDVVVAAVFDALAECVAVCGKADVVGMSVAPPCTGYLDSMSTCGRSPPASRGPMREHRNTCAAYKPAVARPNFTAARALRSTRCRYYRN